MKTARKVLLLVMCAVLLICASVAGTVAYLQSEASVKNTFTVGKVAIDLWEYDLDIETGKQKAPQVKLDRGVGIDQIKIIPGRKIEKEPTVTVKKGSEDCYVRVFVIVGWKAGAREILKNQSYESCISFDANWTKTLLFDSSTNVNVNYDVYELRYNAKVLANTSADQDLTVFKDITIPGDFTSEQTALIDGLSVQVIAQAVQAEGFADADAAFTGAGLPALLLTWQDEVNEGLGTP